MIAPALLLSLLVTGPTNAGIVALGRTTIVDGLRVTPLEIVEDSRCAPTVVCVWAGRVVVAVRVSRGARTLIHRMILGEPVGTPLGNLVLDRVSPKPQQRDAYQLHFSPLTPD